MDDRELAGRLDKLEGMLQYLVNLELEAQKEDLEENGEEDDEEEIKEEKKSTKIKEVEE